MKSLEEFIKQHGITEVECLVPDMSGIARGKIVPADKLLRIMRDMGLRLPEAVFAQTVTGNFIENEDVLIDPAHSDVYLIPDLDSVRLVPWHQEPTALVICDAVYKDNKPVDFSSRYILRHLLNKFEEMGLRPKVAPELEFYLVKINKDSDYPLEPAEGRTGRDESGRQAYGIDAVNEFDPIFESVYDFCEAQDIDIDILTHESGAGQIEINFNHGDPMKMADQAFVFKRTMREAAMMHNTFATFMAKPMQEEPGSAMHVHASLYDIKTGKNAFATPKGKPTETFNHFMGGLQRYLPSMMPLIAPNVNSYRRMVKDWDCPVNVHWGYDNRTVGFRVPYSNWQDTRIENRVPGADANPYLAIAATLACGYLGLQEKLDPADPVEGNAYRLAHTLPRHHFDAINKFSSNKFVRNLLGKRFVTALKMIKESEFDAYHEVISSWERENLLLNV